MALITKAQKLYKIFQGNNGKYYKLIFFAGTSAGDLTYPLLTDGSAEITDPDVEFPDYVIFNEAEGENGFPDDIAWGMPKLETLKLKLWMPGFDSKYVSDTTYTNWDVVRGWIKARRSPTTQTVNGVDIYIPNVWAILGSSDGGTTYTTIESLTIQDVTPEKDFDFAEEVYEITGLDLILSAYKQVTYSIIAAGISPSSNTQRVNMQKWTSGGTDRLIYYEGSLTDSTIYYNNLASTDNVIVQTLIQNVVRAYIRDVTQVIASWRTALNHITFYKQDTTDDAGNKSTVLTDNTIYEIEQIKDGSSNVKDGLYFDGQGENFEEQKNAFNLYKEYTEMFLSHVSINRSGSTFQMLFQRLFNYLDSAGSPVAAITIEEADIIGKPTMKESKNIVRGGITHLRDIGQNDVSEYDYDLNGSLSEKQAETRPLLHNHPIFQEGTDTLSEGGWFFGSKTAIMNVPIMRGIYYVDSSELFKVHDWVSIDIGTGTAVESGALSGTLPSNPKNFQDWVYTRLDTSGFGYTFAKAGATAFGSEYQFGIEFDTDSDNIDLNDLGKLLDLDIGTLTSSDYMTPPHATEGKITGVKVDYIKSITTVKAYFPDPGI